MWCLSLEERKVWRSFASFLYSLAIRSLILGSLNNLDNIVIPKRHFQKPLRYLQICGSKETDDKAESVTALQLIYQN